MRLSRSSHGVATLLPPDSSLTCSLETTTLSLTVDRDGFWPKAKMPNPRPFPSGRGASIPRAKARRMNDGVLSGCRSGARTSPHTHASSGDPSCRSALKQSGLVASPDRFAWGRSPGQSLAIPGGRSFPWVHRRQPGPGDPPGQSRAGRQRFQPPQSPSARPSAGVWVVEPEGILRDRIDAPWEACSGENGLLPAGRTP